MAFYKDIHYIEKRSTSPKPQTIDCWSCFLVYCHHNFLVQNENILSNNPFHSYSDFFTSFFLELPTTGNYLPLIEITCQVYKVSHYLKMALSGFQIVLMVGMLVTGSINTISKKAQNDCK